MALYYQDWFGDQDASKDQHLFECFTQLPSHVDALHPKYFTIRAFKGSGKTAFLEQLKYCSKSASCKKTDSCPFAERFCEEMGDYFIIPIDVTKISFQTLFDLSRSKSDPRLEITVMLVNVFKLILINSVVSKIEKSPELYSEYKEITKYYKKEKILSTSKSILSNLFIAAEKSVTSSSDLASVISSTFLENSNIDKVYTLCVDFLKSINKIAILVLDEFDIIIDLFKSSENQKFFFHQTIATSLLEIAYNGHSIEDEDLASFPDNNVRLKILFPEDLYSILRPRDKQKYDRHAIKLRWSSSDLKTFLNRRIKILLPDRLIKKESGELLSNILFDKKINNNFYHKPELPIEYIIRHTLFKPRDIQQICLSITEEFIEKKNIRSKELFFKNLPIDENSIRDGVVKGTQQIIEYLITEFETFNLKKILGILKYKSNIMKYGELYNLLSKEGFTIGELNLTDVINKLWEIGIIGVLKEGRHEILETYRKYKVFKDSNGVFYVSLFAFAWRNDVEFSNEDMVVIAPMFSDYLDLKIVEDRLIYNF
jgi:hypothetical protein